MKPIKSDRFLCREVSSCGKSLDAVQCRVLVDRQTGVNYLWAAAGYGSGLTVLVDAEGRPLVTPIPPEEE